MREDGIVNWKMPEYKEAQVHFYSEVVQELRGFNEAFRKYISHADPDAFYDRDYALSILKHVRLFMQKLAEKIAEGKVMPKYWDTV